ncbi:ABC transporter substrate-binding protein [Paracoccus sp. (in: a-proteobacteria)]|uniref:ABC transporter substrate-binding protein n=1 Tax=Paracoccus sp. TaxID=267 RepID=UPI0028A1E430|nr:ABC transporter substrate-binding protein [Paracoccus sp. (in: a-proteobacteria)]
MRLTSKLLSSLSGVVALGLSAAAPAQAATPPDALVIAWNIDAISTFDPAQLGEVVAIDTIVNICDRLMEYDPADETKVIPSLAESYTVSEDGKVLTFKIRQGMSFPSGNPATAADMAWSLQRVVKLGLGASASLTEYGFNKDTIESTITAPDDTTLVMQLDRPYPPSLILQAIASYPVAIMLDRETVMANEINGDMGNKYLATHTECVGPYKLMRWNPGEVVLMQSNDNYWGDKPAMKTVLIRHVAEAATQRLMLESGDIDVARDLTPEDIDALEGKPGLTIERTLRPQLSYIALNNEFGPFTDPKARLALRYLLDYDAMESTILKGVGIIRQSPVQLGAVGALNEAEGRPFKLDIEKAKALLAEAGVAPGTKLSLIVGTKPTDMAISQHFQENAAKAGLKVSVERMAGAQLFSKVRAREFQMAFLGWQSTVGDAHGMASRLIYNPDNRIEAKLSQYPSWRSAYFSEEVNNRVTEALFETDPAKREALYHQIQIDQMQEGPQVIVFQSTSRIVHSDALKNWTFHGFRSFYNKVTK